jgi:hypothetical protein
MDRDNDMTADEARDMGLLDELRAIAGRVDPVPEAMVLAARSAIAWRNLDANLAALTYDSVLDDELVGVRSVTAPRLVTFAAGELEIEVQVGDDGPDKRVVGQIVPPGPATVVLKKFLSELGPDVEVAADELGRFSFDRVQPCTVRLEVRPAADGARPVRTDWLIL